MAPFSALRAVFTLDLLIEKVSECSMRLNGELSAYGMTHYTLQLSCCRTGATFHTQGTCFLCSPVVHCSSFKFSMSTEVTPSTTLNLPVPVAQGLAGACCRVQLQTNVHTVACSPLAGLSWWSCRHLKGTATAQGGKYDERSCTIKKRNSVLLAARFCFDQYYSTSLDP